MTTLRPVGARLPAPRPRSSPGVGAALLVLALATLLAACGSSETSLSPRTSGSAASSAPPSADATATPPTPSPSPTPMPTPQYTNPADPELAALIPTEVAGLAVAVPPVEEFAITPGDFGDAAYGELGLRFTALQLAYVSQPRLSLYVARVNGQPVETQDLEPHLPTAGQYVGIAGLVRDPWELVEIDGRLTWVRPEDNATAAGTMIYTWAAEEYVFLMIGTDDAVNRAMFAALPGEPAPTPTPRPSRSPAGSAEPSGSAEESEAAAS